MVPTKANQCQAIAKKHKLKLILSLILLAITVGMTVVGIGYLILNLNKPQEPPVIIEDTPEPAPEPDSEPVLPEKVDFQSVVDAWVSNVSGNKSVLIYDLERNETAGIYNATEDYGTASLYKLFVVYEGYRRLQSGEWQADDSVGSTGYTTLKCLDLAIRESYSPCAETLWAKIGHDNLDNIIEQDFKITNSDISRLISNPQDIMRIMRIFYEHTEITNPALLATMKDSFLNQPTTTYNWRQGLPSGFKQANVYNKVGWEYNAAKNYWNIYHDAAIVEFPEKDRHFIVVVMTNQVPYQKISQLGEMIEAEFNKY